MSKGVIVVKAAGNAGSDGPFRADVATAVGAITVASVEAKDSSGVSVSKFSSYGPVSDGQRGHPRVSLGGLGRSRGWLGLAECGMYAARQANRGEGQTVV